MDSANTGGPSACLAVSTEPKVTWRICLAWKCSSSDGRSASATRPGSGADATTAETW